MTRASNKLRVFAAFLAIAMAATATAEVIHDYGYEDETEAGAGIVPQNMFFTGAGGDLTDPDSYGISDSSPANGTYNYFANLENTAMEPGGWGGTWHGASTGGDGMGVSWNENGYVRKDYAIANGGDGNPLTYVDIVEGCSVTVSAMIATDPNDPVTGEGQANVHFEFFNDLGELVYRTDFAGNNTAPTLTSDGDGGQGSLVFDSSGAYQLLTSTHTFDYFDEIDGIIEARGLVATSMGDGTFGDGSVGGTIWVDDFMLETTCNLVTVGTPAETSGDFNGDGNYDCADIDALIGAIAGGSTDTSFDLTGDGSVTIDDRDAWLAEAGAENLASGGSYLLGDYNLDGVVDVGDFNIWNSNKFTNTGAWCLGDANADGVSDVGDFNIWNTAKFTSADSGAAAVPEPSSLALIGLAMLGLLGVRRR